MPFIPGRVTQIRYHRPGKHAGRYYHDFAPESNVRMHANRDGSVTLRGARKIHATEDEPGFWEKYGHGGGAAMRSNARTPRRRQYDAPERDSSGFVLFAAGAVLLYLWAQNRQAGGGGFSVTDPATWWPSTGGGEATTIFGADQVGGASAGFGY